jgi:hypothetical protein
MLKKYSDSTYVHMIRTIRVPFKCNGLLKLQQTERFACLLNVKISMFQFMKGNEAIKIFKDLNWGLSISIVEV